MAQLPFGIPVRVAAGIVGLGLTFVWLSAVFHWHYLAKDAGEGMSSMLYYAAMLLVSVGCMAVVLWMGFQDEALRERDRWRGQLDARLQGLEEQLQALVACWERQQSAQGAATSPRHDQGGEVTAVSPR
jgi:hypothetical protein